MNKTEGKNLRVVLYEGPGSAPLPAEDRFRAISALLQNGFEVSHPAAGGSVARNDGAPLLVFGRFDGQAPPIEGAEVRDVNGLGADGVLAAARDAREKSGARKLEAWKPWFPVIDYDRCTNCMQCLTFCLFEVYGVDKNDKLTVQNQSNCKTDCPACSRVCPEVAILFPKYKAGPINGDEVNAADLEREKMKVDISALLGGDIYAALRQRSQHASSRFARERDDQRALEERKKCLAKLQAALDIPAEVMNALPTADAIRARADRAAGEGPA
jgi:Pyruvate/2-oxoacid:ferredoxin oxidoreductase delta subunit